MVLWGGGSRQARHRRDRTFKVGWVVLVWLMTRQLECDDRCQRGLEEPGGRAVPAGDLERHSELLRLYGSTTTVRVKLLRL
jgi:hypothetical protein